MNDLTHEQMIRLGNLALNCGGKGGKPGPCKVQAAADLTKHVSDEITHKRKAKRAKKKGDVRSQVEAESRAKQSSMSAYLAFRRLSGGD